MSQSKAQSAGKGTGKAKKPAAAKRKDEVETLRIIPAQTAAPIPALELTAAEQERTSRAKALAEDIELAIREAGPNSVVLDPEGVQALLSALCKVYSAHSEAGERYDAFATGRPVTPTDVMVTASGLLKAANLAVFELGMWQSWTGR